MKIVLLGYRAVGKSTLGKLVAGRLDWPYRDIDRGIEEVIGQSITDYYQVHGEDPYRAIESQVVETMCRQDRCVIAFGAGSVMRPVNRRHARHDSLVFYLEASPELLWERVQNDPASASTRPALGSGGFSEVVEVLEQRAPVYRECADVVLDATASPDDLADQVIAAVEAR
jgi:shikimate kinase